MIESSDSKSEEFSRIVPHLIQRRHQPSQQPSELHSVCLGKTALFQPVETEVIQGRGAAAKTRSAAVANWDLKLHTQLTIA